MRYNKQPISINDQIAILKGRGLIFSDEQKACPSAPRFCRLLPKGRKNNGYFCAISSSE